MIQKPGRIILFLGIIALFTLLLSPLIGGYSVDLFKAVSNRSSLHSEILFNLRLPRVLFAFSVGGSLALVGAVFQALLRNDLATPYTLGVSSGGAFGAVVAIKTGLVLNLAFLSTTSLFSIFFSLVTISFIYWIARERQSVSIYTLILAGVAISFFFSAMILFVHYMADFTETYRMVRWLMGALDITGWGYPLLMMILTAGLFLYFFLNSEGFNLLLAGDEMAMSKGLHVVRLQKRSFFLASTLVGIIVSLAGPIGFVGLIIPHVVRMLSGPAHRYLFPGALLAGGSFLVLCDTLARTIIHPAELPVGVITSIFGGPFFIYLLIRRRRLS